MELSEAVDRILWKEWDPLGVYNEPGLMDDEYEPYVPAVVAMLEEGKDVTHIANHLAAIARKFMDLTDAHPDMRVAKLLIECAGSRYTFRFSIVTAGEIWRILCSPHKQRG